MKISKVDHTRTAVADINNRVGGFQYKDPSKSRENLDERIKGRISSSKGAYKIFNSINAKQTNVIDGDVKNVQDTIKKLNDNLGKIFIVNQNKDKDIADINTIKKGISKANEIGSTTITLKKNDEEVDCIEYCLHKYLKKALRDKVDSLKIIIDAMGSKPLPGGIDDAIDDFAGALKTDFNRKKVSDHVEKSIENQNMPVQPEGSGRLMLPNDGTEVSERAEEEKEGIQKFLSDFATLDEETRMEDLRRISRLIDLFFGVDKTNKIPEKLFVKGKIVETKIPKDLKMPEQVPTEAFNVWERHEERKKNTDYFVSIPKVLLDGSKLNFKDRTEKTEDCKKAVRKRIAQCYLYSLMVATHNKKLFFDSAEKNIFWLRRIEYLAEKIADSAFSRGFCQYKLKTGYISEKVWKEILNLISTKYISLGKAVFNFCMDDMYKTGEDKNMGKLKSGVDHISSFEYEIIKANETLQRETSVAVAFAANNLARATVDCSKEGYEDFLSLKITVDERKDTKKDVQKTQKKDAEEDEKKYVIGDLLISKSDNSETELEETLRNIFQFFGGKSKWDKLFQDESEKIFKEKPEEHGLDLFINDNYNDPKKYPKNDQDKSIPHIYFLDDLKKILFALRNENFHFVTANVNKGDWNTKLIGEMFEKETAACISYEKEKFCSNNLPEFYSKDNLLELLDKLYDEYVPRASQVPAFNKVFVRDKFGECLAVDFGKSRLFSTDNDKKERWLSALYYAFKEIYYNCFLRNDTVKKYFCDALNEDYSVIPKVRKERTKEQRPLGDFGDRFETIKNIDSFGTICQLFMTEYNYQNSGNRKVKSTERQEKDPDIFEHYKMLLTLYIKKAFIKYVKENNDFKFLLDDIFDKDDDATKNAIKEFSENEWTSGKYNDLVSKIKEKKTELQKWYILGRFLNGKTLNQLVGSLNSYKQYIGDVKRRAAENGKRLNVKENVSTAFIDEAIEVLDICRQLSSRTSNKITDYFKDNDEYAKYVDKYVDLGDYSNSSAFINLQHIDVEHVFTDAVNPICNRNIIMSKLFGPDEVVCKCRTKISEDDIKQYQNADNDIAKYKVKGATRNKSEQKKLAEYQAIINRVELRDVVEYGEIINDLYGQLINWCYLRERDLMYFQLGFHYECLKNASTKPDDYKKVTLGNGTTLNNAILHQIAAMYVNGVGMLDYKNDQYYLKNETALIGGKIGMFNIWSKKIIDDALCKDKKKKMVVIYNAGLEVFENLNEHDNITDIRNYIDHFKYYAGKDEYGILDMYSEVFDRFFSYDDKYRKNVPNMLMNILLKDYHVILSPAFSKGEKKIGRGEDAQTKERAQIGIREGSLKANLFTYKRKDESTKKEVIFTLGAKSDEFLKTVAKILYYPANKQETEIESLIYKNTEDEETEENRQNNSGDGDYKKHEIPDAHKQEPAHEKNIIDVQENDIKVAYVNGTEQKKVKFTIKEDKTYYCDTKNHSIGKKETKDYFPAPTKLDGENKCWLKVRCTGHNDEKKPEWEIIAKCIGKEIDENSVWETLPEN